MRERFSRRVEERTFLYRAERPTHREKNHQAARLERLACRGLWSDAGRKKRGRLKTDRRYHQTAHTLARREIDGFIGRSYLLQASTDQRPCRTLQPHPERSVMTISI